jgi:hypothetical protein
MAQRRTTTLKRLRENIDAALEQADIYQKLSDIPGEAYRRGNIAAYATAASMLVDAEGPEARDFRAMAEAQRIRIQAIRYPQQVNA